MDLAGIQKRVDELQWTQSFEIVPGVMTHGIADQARRLRHFGIPEDLSGKRVLDIGCNDGYFTFLAEERGGEVVAIDCWPRRGFELAHELRGSKAEFRHMTVYAVSPETLGYFDVVFFFGVCYHLKKPMLALERIASVTNEQAIIESEITVSRDLASSSLSVFYSQDQLLGDMTNWWVPTVTNLLETAQAAGFPRAELVSTYDRTRGVVRCLKGPRTSGKALNEDLIITLDAPPANQVVEGTVSGFGWAVSQISPEHGIDRITGYLDNLDDPASELGAATYGLPRPDLARTFGNEYGQSGFKFSWDLDGVKPGEHVLYLMAEGEKGWHYRGKPIVIR